MLFYTAWFENTLLRRFNVNILAWICSPLSPVYRIYVQYFMQIAALLFEFEMSN